MPILNGLEATKHYRMSALDLPHLPIIGLTRDATARMEERCLDAGMDACLTKPNRFAPALCLCWSNLFQVLRPLRANPA